MRCFLLLFSIALLLSGCQLLKQGKEINQRYYAEGELKRITRALEIEEPSLKIPSTLYLYDESGKYTEELSSLLAISKVSDPIGAKIALLAGDGEKLLARSSDTLLLINAHLLMGNVFEAERLMQLSDKKDLATEAIIHLRQGREEEATVLLNQVLGQYSDEVIKLRAARLLSVLERGGWEYLRANSPSEWERFMASVQLGNRSGQTPRERAYIQYISTLEHPDSLQAYEAAQGLLAEPTAPWRQHALLHIIPLIIKYEHWVMLFKIAEQCPEMSKDYPIEYQILQLSREIELMARFEAPEEASTSILPTMSSEGSFRTQWGTVANVDNWVMARSNLLSNPVFTARPTPEQYESARQMVARFLGK